MKCKLISLLLAFCTMGFAGETKKILLLIIASDNYPVYTEFQKSWSSYMHSDPEHVEAYFLKGDPNLPVQVKIDGDVIWCKTDEGFSPQSAGIINKTILSFEKMLPRIKEEFDYVVRTNLSSFYVFPKLFEFLDTLPSENCYAGSNTGPGSDIISGTGIILSADLVEKLVQNKQSFMNRKSDPDDCLIGFFFRKIKMPLHLHRRYDIETVEQWEQMKGNLPAEAFQFRVKTNVHNFYDRVPNDLTIHSDLYNIFYRKTL